MKTKMLVILICVYFHIPTKAMNIEEYVNNFKTQNSMYKSQQATIESTSGKLDSAEMDLTPMLNLNYLNGEDKSLPNQLSSHRTTEQYSLGLSKKFITGTSVKLDAKSYNFENENTVFPGFDRYSTGLIGVTISQSLWKDFFGYGTRTKIKREKTLAELEMSANELQNRALIMNAEFVYWDFVLAQEDLTLKKSNLERAQKLQKWTSKRVENGISDKSDSLNANALVSLRQMQLLMSENEYKNAEIKFRDNLELSVEDKTPIVQVNWKEARPYVENLKNKKNVVKIEDYLSTLEARSKNLIAEETLDSLKPDLSIFGTYNYTSYDRERVDALSDVTKSDYPQSAIGVNLTWLIDGSAKNGLRQSARQTALAAKLSSDKKMKDGLKSWTEYLRIYDVNLKQTQILNEISDLQKKRANSENERFSKGRTYTAAVVTAESDSAEAEVNFLKSKIGLRKFEASSLMFMDLSEIK